MIVPQLVITEKLIGASDIPTSGAQGFLFGGFLTFTGTSDAASTGTGAELLTRMLTGMGL